MTARAPMAWALLGLLLAASSCSNTWVDLSDDVPDSGLPHWTLCSGIHDPICDDGDPCTSDLCSVAFPCGYDECVGRDEGPTICWNLPLDADLDGHATGAGVCAARGWPWDDCCDGDSRIAPDLVEVCDDGLDNDCDGMTDTDDPYCGGGGL